MKKLLIYSSALLLTYMVEAQCENAYFPFQQGSKFEQTSYNGKDKEQGKTTNVITSAEENKVVVQTTIFDKKGKELTQGEYEVICEDGSIKMDVKKFIPSEIMDNYQNMEVTIEGDFLEFPNELSVGKSLPDGSGKLIVKMAEGAMDMNTTMEMTFKDRKVEGKETITTPSGTYETFKVSQTTISKMSIMGMNRETTFTSNTWIAEKVGPVKVENYDSKGKLNGYTLLTSFEE